MNKFKLFCPATLAKSIFPMAIFLASPQALYAEDSKIMLEEVIVTAQKKQQSLQETAVAVTALDGNDLAVERISSVLDLQSMAPSLQVGTIFGQAKVFIRGIGLTNFAAGAESSVAYHIDGAVVSRPKAQIGAYYDLARVEVLRGPQGSLYGRNATGGSINIITNRPTEEWEGYVNLTAGNYGLMELEGAVSGSLIDDVLLGRIAFQSNKRDGFGENIFNGQDIADSDTQAIRASLSYVGSENFEAFLSYNHYEEDDANYPVNMLGAGNPAVTPPEIALGGTIAPDFRDLNSEAEIFNKKDYDSITLEMVWDLGDYKLKSLSNYLEYESDSNFDLNGTPEQYLTATDDRGSEQYSTELQLTYEGENLSTLFGLYYFNEEIHARQTFPGPVLFTDVLMRNFVDFQGVLESESYAAFANVTWQLNEEWAVSGGLRYSKDEKVDNGSLQIPPGAIIPVVNREGDWDAWTPKLTIEYTPSDDLFFYATASEGYKVGVMNIGSPGAAVDPENVTNFEVGMKSEWWDNRFQLNTVLFYADIKDLQVQRAINGTLVTVNADGATTQGLELETITLLSEGLTLKISGAFVDAKFEDFPTANTTFDSTLAINVEGNPLPSAPELQADISLEYNVDFTSDWSAKFKLQGVYTDERWFNEFKESIAYQEATTVINGNVLIRSADDQWTINLWGRNLSDKEIIAHINVTSSTPGHMRTAALEAPRTFGVTLGYSF